VVGPTRHTRVHVVVDAGAAGSADSVVSAAQKQ
jgi:hypothetical protein